MSDDARGRLGRRLPQHRLPRRRGAPCRRRTPSTARRAVGARRSGDGDPRAADRPRPGDGRVVGPVAARQGRARRPHRPVRAYVDPAGAGPGSARGVLAEPRTCECDWRCCGGGLRHPQQHSHVRGATHPGRRPGRGHVGLDRLRGPPPLGSVRRPARRRRPVADLGLRGAGRGDRGPTGGPAPGQRLGARRLALGEAVRRLRRRDVGPDHPRDDRPRLPRRVDAGPAGAG